MLMALLLASLLGGSAEFFVRDDFRAVESVIEEPERAAAAIAIMERINNRMNGIFNQRRELVARISTLDLDVEASPDAYSAYFDELWQRREQATDGYVRDVFEMREHISREEWAAIFDPTEDDE